MIAAIGYGILVPAGVAAGVTWVLQRLLRDKAAGRYLSAMGLACGFLAGYSLAADGTWWPERHWHWLPYLAVAATIVGPIATKNRTSVARRGTLFLLLAIAVAVALVPRWASRAIQIPGLASFLLIVLLLYDPLPQRVARRSLLPLLYVCGFATAAFVAASVSLSYGQLAGLAVAAFTGNSLVFWLKRDRSGIRELLPAWVVLLAGAAYVGCIYPDDPNYVLLLPPAAPLVLWVFCCGPLSRLQGIRRAVAEYTLVLLVLIGTAILLFTGSFGESGSDW